MITKVDKNGKLLLPKKLMVKLGITNRASLKMTLKGNGILIEPIKDENSVIEKDGILVYTGEILENIEVLLEKSKDERISHNLG